MTVYRYTEDQIETGEAIDIKVHLWYDAGWLYRNDECVFAGVHDDLLDELHAIVSEAGLSSPTERHDRTVDGHCLVCDSLLIPAIHHSTTCQFCDRAKATAMAGLSEVDRLIRGQSCVEGHFVCPECWQDRRENTGYLELREQSLAEAFAGEGE